jgi:hypothetical protein
MLRQEAVQQEEGDELRQEEVQDQEEDGLNNA